MKSLDFLHLYQTKIMVACYQGENDVFVVSIMKSSKFSNICAKLQSWPLINKVFKITHFIIHQNGKSILHGE